MIGGKTMKPQIPDSTPTIPISYDKILKAEKRYLLIRFDDRTDRRILRHMILPGTLDRRNQSLEIPMWLALREGLL
jgi:hypothetical protein